MIKLGRGLASAIGGGFRFPLLAGGVLAVAAVLVAAACGGGEGKEPATSPPTSSQGQGALASTLITVYSSPT